MSIFATEFPVRAEISEAKFLALSLSWLRGMKSSTLRFSPGSFESYEDEVTFLGDDGEKYSLKTLRLPNGFVIGGRHDLPTSSGLNWRTETVLTNLGKGATLRVRGQCFSTSPAAPTQVPRKPYFIKACLQDNWGGEDGPFAISDQPILLKDGEEDTAAKIVLGELNTFLPILYMSITATGSYTLDPAKLAFDLGGLCHVVMEPSISFSRRLADATERLNPYQGTIGYCDPEKGMLRRFYLGGNYPDPKSLEGVLRNFVVRQVAARESTLGWEWQELQTEFARSLRRKAKAPNNSGDKEWEDLLNAEIAAKEETIENLRQRISILQNQPTDLGFTDGLLPPALSRQIGDEIYENEFSDRVLLIVRKALTKADLEIGDRTREVGQRLLLNVEFSKRAVAFHSELKNAGRDYKTSTAQLRPILARLGFDFREDGSHINAVPGSNTFGFSQVTLPKTPSDTRSGMNAVRDITQALDLKDLKSGD